MFEQDKQRYMFNQNDHQELKQKNNQSQMSSMQSFSLQNKIPTHVQFPNQQSSSSVTSNTYTQTDEQESQNDKFTIKNLNTNLEFQEKQKNKFKSLQIINPTPKTYLNDENSQINENIAKQSNNNTSLNNQNNNVNLNTPTQKRRNHPQSQIIMNPNLKKSDSLNYQNNAKQLFEQLKQQKIEEKHKQFLKKEQQNRSKCSFKDIFIKLKLKHYILSLLDTLSYRKYRYLTKVHFDILGEYKFEKPESKKLQLVKFCLFIVQSIPSMFKKQTLIPILQKIPKILPDSTTAILLNLISSLIIITVIFFINMVLFFQAEFKDLQYQKVCIGILVYFILEFFVRINIAVMKDGKVETDPHIILNNYRKKFLFQDFTSIIALLIYICFFKPQQNQYIRFVCELVLLLKIITLVHLKNDLENKLSMNGFSQHLLELIKMLSRLAVLAHFLGSFWHILSIFQIKYLDYKDTWLQQNDLQDKEWQSRYVESFYWSTSNIMLIGGKGFTTYEVLLQTIMLFFTVGLFAQILENISQLLQEISKDTEQYKQDLSNINKYMRNKQLDQKIQIKVRQYIQHCHKSRQELNVNTKAQIVLEQLPFYLQEKIRDEVNKQIVKNFHLLYNNFSQKSIQTLSSNTNIMQETSYVSQDIIFSQNKKPTEMCLYLILSGEVELFFTKKGNKNNENEQSVIIKKLQKGDIFGDESFFTGLLPCYSAKCTKFSNICKIDRTKFLLLLKNNQKDYERFQVIRDEFIQQGVTKRYKKNCIICESQYHNEERCSLMVLRPHRYKRVLEDQFKNPPQYERKRYFRALKQITNRVIPQAQETKNMNQYFRKKYSKFSRQVNLNIISYYLKIGRFLGIQTGQELQESLKNYSVISNKNFNLDNCQNLDNETEGEEEEEEEEEDDDEDDEEDFDEVDDYNDIFYEDQSNQTEDKFSASQFEVDQYDSNAILSQKQLDSCQDQNSKNNNNIKVQTELSQLRSKSSTNQDNSPQTSVGSHKQFHHQELLLNGILNNNNNQKQKEPLNNRKKSYSTLNSLQKSSTYQPQNKKKIQFKDYNIQISLQNNNQNQNIRSKNISINGANKQNVFFNQNYNFSSFQNEVLQCLSSDLQSLNSIRKKTKSTKTSRTNKSSKKIKSPNCQSPTPINYEELKKLNKKIEIDTMHSQQKQENNYEELMEKTIRKATQRLSSQPTLVPIKLKVEKKTNFFLDFDMQVDYLVYYPKYNLTSLVKKYNKFRETHKMQVLSYINSYQRNNVNNQRIQFTQNIQQSPRRGVLNSQTNSPTSCKQKISPILSQFYQQTSPENQSFTYNYNENDNIIQN